MGALCEHRKSRPHGFVSGRNGTHFLPLRSTRACIHGTVSRAKTPDKQTDERPKPGRFACFRDNRPWLLAFLRDGAHLLNGMPW